MCQTNIETARQTATAIFESFYGPSTKAGITSTRSVEYVKDSAAIAVNMYPEGFVLFQNNKDKTPLIISDEGEFSNLNENPVSAEYLSSILKQISGHRDGYDPDPSFAWMEERNVQEDSVIVAPIIPVQWHQQAPYNLYAPNGHAGCFPVAWTQIMSVYSYPTTLELTYSGADVAQTNLDWPSLISHDYFEIMLPSGVLISSHLKDTCEICKQSGRLLRQLGETFGSTYGIDGTSTGDISSTMLMDVGYTATTGLYEINTVLDNIQSGFPVLLCGGDGHSGNGHAYDADGYKIKTHSYDLYVFESGAWQYDSHNVREQTYLHFNYGWLAGVANGYYIVLDKETTSPNGGSPVVSTYVNSPQGFDYNLVSIAMYGIEPDN